MCCVASSDDSEADASVPHELPMVHMLSSGETHTYNMHAHLIPLQLLYKQTFLDHLSVKEFTP